MTSLWLVPVATMATAIAIAAVGGHRLRREAAGLAADTAALAAVGTDAATLTPAVVRLRARADHFPGTDLGPGDR
jgi:hypothetical protein